MHTMYVHTCQITADPPDAHTAFQAPVKQRFHCAPTVLCTCLDFAIHCARGLLRQPPISLPHCVNWRLSAGSQQLSGLHHCSTDTFWSAAGQYFKCMNGCSYSNLKVSPTWTRSPRSWTLTRLYSRTSRSSQPLLVLVFPSGVYLCCFTVTRVS